MKSGQLARSPAAASSAQPASAKAPVIVLTYAYAGDELLRGLLAADPSLACTSGTGLLPLCQQAANTWHRAVDRSSAALSGLASSAIRTLSATLLTAVLAQTGKKRWCEFAFSAPDSAETFLRLYPDARLICLYRACPEVIKAILRANPWDLAGTPVMPFTAAHPASPAAAAAAYWTERTDALLAFEQRHPRACLRVRHEDLADDPAAALRQISTHVGLGPLTPTLSLSMPRLPAPIDCTTSAGSGPLPGPIPAGLLPPPLHGEVNSLLTRLDYPLMP